MSYQILNTGSNNKMIPSKLASWIRHHPVLTFFILTFVINWLYWLLVPVFFGGSKELFDPLIQIGAFTPALIAMLVSAVLKPQTVKPMRLQRVLVFLMVFVLGCAIWWFWHPLVYFRPSRLNVFELLCAALAAYFVSGYFGNREGVRDLVRRLANWRIGWLWYLLPLILWPALIIVGNALARLLGFDVPAASFPAGKSIFPAYIIELLWVAMFGGGQEEPGWRGFALPKMQAKFSPLVAGIIIGAIWGLWHVPLNFINGVYENGVSLLWTRLFEIPYGILFVWLFNRSNGSLIPVLLWHATSNSCARFMGRSSLIVFSLGTLLLIFLIIADKMWRKLPADRRDIVEISAP
jgi:membrane protease YdiL (CAAX protease family)